MATLDDIVERVRGGAFAVAVGAAVAVVMLSLPSSRFVIVVVDDAVDVVPASLAVPCRAGYQAVRHEGWRGAALLQARFRRKNHGQLCPVVGFAKQKVR